MNAHENSQMVAEAQALVLDGVNGLLETLPKTDLKLRRNGNVGGRPKGSRNRYSRRENPLRRELHKESLEIVRAAITSAKGGDVGAQRLLIDRLLPHGRLIKIKLPKVRTPADAVELLSTILGLAADGTLTSGEAADFASLARSLIEVTAMKEVLDRLEALEQRAAQP